MTCGPLRVQRVFTRLAVTHGRDIDFKAGDIARVELRPGNFQETAIEPFNSSQQRQTLPGEYRLIKSSCNFSGKSSCEVLKSGLCPLHVTFSFRDSRSSLSRYLEFHRDAHAVIRARSFARHLARPDLSFENRIEWTDQPRGGQFAASNPHFLLCRPPVGIIFPGELQGG